MFCIYLLHREKSIDADGPSLKRLHEDVEIIEQSTKKVKPAEEDSDITSDIK